MNTNPALTTTSFQNRVWPWLLECFGLAIAVDKTERNHRFVEEALELAQSCGCSASEAHQLVDYVFERPMGLREQEAGGVMVTLAALCLANEIDMHECGETELARVWTKIEKIRAKQAAKPAHSPLPEVSAVAANAETPRVDAASKFSHHSYGYLSTHELIDFARTLERELTAVRAEIAVLRERLSNLLDPEEL